MLRVLENLPALYLARIKSAFEINDIRKSRVTCYMDEIKRVRVMAKDRFKSTQAHHKSPMFMRFILTFVFLGVSHKASCQRFVNFPIG
jgi:hypothetical protein